MWNIPTYIPPISDEFLPSYILRLSKANEIAAGEFYTQFLSPFGCEPLKNPRTDFIPGLQEIADFHKKKCNFLDPYATFFSGTIFPVIFPFYTIARQVEKIQSAFYLHVGDATTLPRKRVGNINPMFCPECAKEDMVKYGIPYLRTFHQIPSVDTCIVHQCHLQKVLKDDYPDNLKVSEVHNDSPTNRSLEIAKFYHDMYEAPVNIDRKLLRAIISERVNDLGITPAEDRTDFDDYINAKGYGDFPRYKMNSATIQQFIAGKQKENLVNEALYLPCLFTNYDTFKKYAVSRTNITKEYFKQAIEGSFKLISDYGMIVKLKCLKCGYEFICHPYGIFLGLDCPECDRKLSANDIINRQLKFCGDGNYHIDENFNGYGSRLHIIHDTCGKVSMVSPGERIWDEHTCECEVKSTLKDVQKKIDNVSSGFTIVKFESSKSYNKAAIIRHTGGCGETFPIDIRNFILKPACRCCGEKYIKHYTEELGLDTKDFTILGIRRDKAQHDPILIMKHNVPDCGKTFEATFSNFKEFPFCRKCQGAYGIQAVQKKIDEININSEYEVISLDISATPTAITLRHKPCGRQFSTTMALFKRDSFCRKCDVEGRRFAKAQKYFDSIRKGFLVIAVKPSYKGGPPTEYTLKHVGEHGEGCSGTFDVTTPLFSSKSFCRCCEAEQNYIETVIQPKIDAIAAGFKVVKKGSKTGYYVLEHVGTPEEPGCGNTFPVRLDNFKRISLCRCCQDVHPGRGKKEPGSPKEPKHYSFKSIEECQKEIDKISSGFTVKGFETNQKGRKLILLEHTGGCGQTFPIPFFAFHNSPHCIACEGKHKRKSIEQAQKEFDDICPGYNVLKIERAKGKVMYYIQHGTCEPFWITKSQFTAHPYCHSCHEGDKRNIDLSATQKWVDSITPGFDVVGYDRREDGAIRYHIKCKACGEIMKLTRKDFKKRPFCRNCKAGK